METPFCPCDGIWSARGIKLKAVLGAWYGYQCEFPFCHRLERGPQDLFEEVEEGGLVITYFLPCGGLKAVGQATREVAFFSTLMDIA